MKNVTILKTAKASPRAASNIKPQGAAAKPSSFANACTKAAPALQTAARAEAAGREELRRLMAGIVIVAAKGSMSRVDAGKVLADALGLPNMARTVKDADGKHVAADAWIVSTVNAWQYAAKELESRKVEKAEKVAAEGSDAGETETASDTREGKVETAADFVALYVAFRKHGKSAALEALEMIAAREGFVLAKSLAKAA